MTKISLALASLVFTFGIAGSADAALVSRLNGQAVYDTDLNITWQQNANLAATETFGLARNVDLGTIPGVESYGGSYIYDNGGMTWGGALKWIDAMNATNYLGYNDWRLPITLQPDASCTFQSGDGIESYGPNCSGSELGHLFYIELGGTATQSITTSHNANLTLFKNVLDGNYWSSTEYFRRPDSDAWVFGYWNGGQNPIFKDNGFSSWAVRTGDVAAVPIPAAFWLFGSGLAALLGASRRQRAALHFPPPSGFLVLNQLSRSPWIESQT